MSEKKQPAHTIPGTAGSGIKLKIWGNRGGCQEHVKSAHFARLQRASRNPSYARDTAYAATPHGYGSPQCRCAERGSVHASG